MTREQIISRFNPAAAPNFTEAELRILHSLTDDDINALAQAYPNTPTRRAYLRLYDTSKPADKQIYHNSTWQNLRNNRKYTNLKTLMPWDFMTTAKAAKPAPIRPQVKQVPKKIIVDMTAQEAAAELTKSLATANPKAVDLGKIQKPVIKEAAKPEVIKRPPGRPPKEKIPMVQDIPADQNFDPIQ